MLNTQAKQFLKAAIVVVTSAALTFTSSGFAIAASSMSSANTFSNYSTTAEYDARVEQLANDLEILFTRYIIQVDEKYIVNEDAIIEDGYVEQLEDFQTVATGFNDTANYLKTKSFAEEAEHGDVTTAKSAGNYAKCVILGALGIPATAFTYATWTTITTAISAWNWGLAASTIVRALGPAFIGGLGKAIGGPAVIASALAVAAVSCAF